jgi:flagellar basal-body rod protein FlgG
MFRGIYAGTSAMLVQEKMLDVTGNNLANVDTSGFRARIAVNKSFPEVLMDRIERYRDSEIGPQRFNPLGRVPIGTMPLANVLSETAMRTSEGVVQVTDNPLDVAIDGKGYFVVQDEAGNVFYTRQGHFLRDSQGRVVNEEGMVVQGDGGGLEIGDSSNFDILEDGQLLVDGEAVGRLRLVTFDGETYLRQEGRSLLSETPQSGPPQDLDTPRFKRGAVERSNVNVVEEMVRMIEANRAYEASAKTVSIQDELTTRLSSAFGRPS